MKKIQMLWVAHSVAKVGNIVKPHSHGYYHMIYILSGQFEMVVNGDPFVLKEKVCLLIPKGMEHSYVITGKKRAEFLEIKFALLDEALDKELSRLDLLKSEISMVGDLAKQIVDEYSRLGPQADETTACYMLSVLYTLTREQRVQKQQEFRYVDASSYSLLSRRIVHYLEEHFSEKISLEQLAQALEHEKSYLCRAFKKDTKTTILDCLNMIRIRHAAELLTYGDNSMAQISEMCGFASPSNFNRVFLKYIGVTPGQCRRAFPAEVLLRKKDISHFPNRLLYSVLARKQVPLEVYLADTASEP